MLRETQRCDAPPLALIVLLVLGLAGGRVCTFLGADSKLLARVQLNRSADSVAFDTMRKTLEGSYGDLKKETGLGGSPARLRPRFIPTGPPPCAPQGQRRGRDQLPGGD